MLQGGKKRLLGEVDLYFAPIEGKKKLPFSSTFSSALVAEKITICPFRPTRTHHKAPSRPPFPIFRVEEGSNVVNKNTKKQRGVETKKTLRFHSVACTSKSDHWHRGVSPAHRVLRERRELWRRRAHEGLVITFYILFRGEWNSNNNTKRWCCFLRTKKQGLLLACLFFIFLRI